MNTPTTTTAQGMAGNFRVASELLLRGFRVYMPAVDSGVDLLVNECVRVQVKSAHVKAVPRYAGAQPSYGFWLARGPKGLGGGRSTKTVARIFSKTCDFVVLWGIEQGRFWIVPAALLDNRYSVTVGPDMRWIPIDTSRVRQLHAEGMIQGDIAKELGVSEMTVSRRRRGMYSNEPDANVLIHRIKACEGRWENIQDVVDTLTEACEDLSVKLNEAEKEL